MRLRDHAGFLSHVRRQRMVEVFLRGHGLEGPALLVPDFGDIQQHFGPPLALFGLMRLKEEYGRGAQHRLLRMMPM
ncbi:hypothetical protein CTI14_57560, partial [Methylobacterium radiotolerans]